MVLACLFVLALVVLAAAAVVVGIGLGLKAAFSLVRRRYWRGPGDIRLLDAGLVVAALVALVLASLEGVVSAFTFHAADRATTTVAVAAPPGRVWHEVGRATSPEFPLPALLRSIPQPVAVIVDEGAALGARRVVRFRGREGEGDLVLQVVRRTGEEAVFEAISDDSPIAEWVRHRTLTFRVEPAEAGAGSRLTVSLHYDRLLAPAWFFRPYIRLAAWLAVGVLARDTRLRAEAVRR